MEIRRNVSRVSSVRRMARKLVFKLFVSWVALAATAAAGEMPDFKSSEGVIHWDSSAL